MTTTTPDTKDTPDTPDTMDSRDTKDTTHRPPPGAGPRDPLAEGGDWANNDSDTGIFYHLATDLFVLQMRTTSYVIHVPSSSEGDNADGYVGGVEHVYWGPRIHRWDDVRYLREQHHAERVSFDAGDRGKNSHAWEYADQGTGDFRIPAFRLRFLDDGSTVTALRYKSHRIHRQGKPQFLATPHIPHVRAHESVTTLELTMHDVDYPQLEVRP